MYTLLIVDDEKTTREGLLSVIDWKQFPIRIVGEAADGLEAIQKIYEWKPDILICDIKMPHIDGITLITKIRDDFPDMQIIFLSGYSDKEYLKQAIRLKAVDYLDKPFRPLELMQVIEQACLRLEKLSEKQVDLSAALTRVLLGDMQVEKLPAKLCPVDFTLSYTTLVISFNQAVIYSNTNFYDTVESNDIGLFLQLNLPRYQEYIARMIRLPYYAYILHNRYIIHMNTDQDISSLTELVSTFLNCIPEHRPIIAIAFSRCLHGMENLRSSYREALDSKRNYLEGYGKVYSPQPESAFQKYRPELFVPAKITEAISLHNFTDATYLMSEYFNSLKHCRNRDIPLINNDLITLALKIMELLHPGEDIYQFSTIEKIRLHYTCIDDIYAFLNSLVDQLVDQTKTLTPKNRAVYNIEHYIIDHYMEDLSLPQIAKQVYLTPTYMCHLYKKETGKTIVQFLTEIRMKKALELLKNPDISLNTLSEMAGYKTPNYFTKAFTSYYHISPTKMRYQLLSCEKGKNNE